MQKNERNIIALVQDAEFEGEENVVSYYPNGYLYDNDFDTSADLMMLPEKRIGWINVKNDASLFKSRERKETVQKVMRL